MKRGRRPAKNADEFNAMVCNRREFFGYSIAALAKISRVNLGTLSEFFSGRRNGFGYKDRLSLIKAFKLGPKEEERFLDLEHRRRVGQPLILHDSLGSSNLVLEPGQRFLVCGLFPEAIREFETVYKVSNEQRNYVLQADAAAHLGWVWLEQGFYKKSLHSVDDGIRIIETHIGARLPEIMNSIELGSHSSLCQLKDESSRILSRLLGVRYTIFTTGVLYHCREELRSRAMAAVEQSAALDKHLQLSTTLGHDLRWKAVLTTLGAEPKISCAERLLSESKELFAGESLAMGYHARDRGIVNWQVERYAKSSAALTEAVESLASFADSRALGPTFCVLTRVALQTGTDEGQVRRYALAGAALHPYGFVLENARDCVRRADPSGLRRDVENLMSGHRPFEILAPVLSRLADESSSTLTDRLRQNLSKVLPTFNHGLLDARIE